MAKVVYCLQCERRIDICWCHEPVLPLIVIPCEELGFTRREPVFTREEWDAAEEKRPPRKPPQREPGGSRAIRRKGWE